MGSIGVLDGLWIFKSAEACLKFHQIIEQFGSKTLYINFCVFEKNAVKVWNLLGNALENILILAHEIKMVWAIWLKFGM
jgi:hypothetical protein